MEGVEQGPYHLWSAAPPPPRTLKGQIYNWNVLRVSLAGTKPFPNRDYTAEKAPCAQGSFVPLHGKQEERELCVIILLEKELCIFLLFV